MKQSGKDDILRIRLPTELKTRLRRVAENDSDVDYLSEWVRRELRVGLRVAEVSETE